MNEVELTISAQQKEAGSFRLIATLVVAGMISGFALSGAYQVTKPTIDANKARELRIGVFKVVPGSSNLQVLVQRDEALVPVGEEEVYDQEVIYAAYDDNAHFLGYAIVGQAPGYQDTIRLLYGYNPSSQRIIGMYVLESRETPGLGDKIYKDADFLANFTDLAVQPQIIIVKDGRTADNEVDAITGATISSKAVVKIMNSGNEKWLPLLPPSGSEPPLMQTPKPVNEDDE